MMMVEIGLPAGGVVSNGVRRDKSLSNQDQPATVACSEHSENSVPVFFWSRPLSVAFLTEKWNSPLAWPSARKDFDIGTNHPTYTYRHLDRAGEIFSLKARPAAGRFLSALGF